MVVNLVSGGFDWGSLPDWGVLAVAIFALIIARRQWQAAGQANDRSTKAIEEAARSASDQAQIARASLILEIDRDFESAEMQESRLAIRGLRNDIEAFVRLTYQEMDGDTLDKRINENFSEYLNTLWRDFRKADAKPEKSIQMMMEQHLTRLEGDPGRIEPHERCGLHYQRLTRLLGWLERVAHMVNQGLLPEQDVITLYDVVFIDLGKCFGGHLRYRREDGPTKNPNYMKEMRVFRDRILALRKEAEYLPTKAHGPGITGFR